MGKSAFIPIAAVIGHPVDHSLSPATFALLGKRLKRPVLYTRFDVSTAKLSSFYKEGRELGVFTGWNVTIPHKEAIAKKVSKLSKDAKQIGAVNVVHFSKSSAIGYNTDFLGVLSTFKEQGTKLKGQVAVVFGAGGAAMASLYALGKSGSKTVWIVNRTQANAKRLCHRFNKLFPKTDFRFVASAALIESKVACVINATPIGLKGFKGHFTFPRVFAPKALAFDLLYAEQTPFLKEAKRLRLKTVNGLDMFLWQAIATWEIWFGRVPNASVVKRRLKLDLLKKS